jgi:hypothetical protein
MKLRVPRVGKEVVTFIPDHEATMIIYTWAMRSRPLTCQVNAWHTALGMW